MYFLICVSQYTLSSIATYEMQNLKILRQNIIFHCHFHFISYFVGFISLSLSFYLHYLVGFISMSLSFYLHYLVGFISLSLSFYLHYLVVYISLSLSFYLHYLVGFIWQKPSDFEWGKNLTLLKKFLMLIEAECTSTSIQCSSTDGIILLKTHDETKQWKCYDQNYNQML